MTFHNILFTDNDDLFNSSHQELTKISNQVIQCESTIIFDNTHHYIVHKKCSDSSDELIGESSKDSIGESLGESSEVFITMSKINDLWEFTRGYLYKDGKEIAIKNYTMFRSIQLGEWACDLLGICYL